MRRRWAQNHELEREDFFRREDTPSFPARRYLKVTRRIPIFPNTLHRGSALLRRSLHARRRSPVAFRYIIAFQSLHYTRSRYVLLRTSSRTEHSSNFLIILPISDGESAWLPLQSPLIIGVAVPVIYFNIFCPFCSDIHHHHHHHIISTLVNSLSLCFVVPIIARVASIVKFVASIACTLVQKSQAAVLVN